MGDFESNPDIDENPPIPLRDALEKMKPFLMAYEGIQSHEEWEVSFSITKSPCFRSFVLGSFLLVDLCSKCLYELLCGF